jgi:putative transposase
MKSTTVLQFQIKLSDLMWNLATEARQEAARLWNRMVKLHLWFRRRQKSWPTQSDFEKHFKGKFKLHSQTIQAIIQRFFTNIETTRTIRKSGDKRARYPYKLKHYTNLLWKGQAIKFRGNSIILPMGKGRQPLRIRLPKLPDGKVVQAELAFGRLLLTLSKEIETPKAGKNIGAADLGSIHLAVVTDGESSLAVVGRGLRSINQGLAKALAEVSALQSRCEKGSRRWRKLRATKRRLIEQAKNQSRNLLHHASNEMVEFCQQQEIGTLVVGDIAEINKGKSKKRSRRLNQEMGLLSLGLLVVYLNYKLARVGIVLDKKSEEKTTKTCPACGHKQKPRGRIYKCSNAECNFVGVRDEVGAFNQRNKYLNSGNIVTGFSIPKGKVKYLRPVKLKGFAERSRAADTGQSSIHALCAGG